MPLNLDYLKLSSHRQTIDTLNQILAGFVSDTDEVLDVGCGSQTKILNANNLVITGCDLDDEALKHNKHIQDYKVCSAEELPFEESKFQMVMSFDVLEHIEAPEQFTQRAYDVLKPGGYFIGITPNLNSLYGRIVAQAPLAFLRIGSKILTGKRTENEVHWYRMNTSKDCDTLLSKAGFESVSTVFLNRLPTSKPLRYILFPYYSLCRMKWAQKYSVSLLFIGRKPL